MQLVMNPPPVTSGSAPHPARAPSPATSGVTAWSGLVLAILIAGASLFGAWWVRQDEPLDTASAVARAITDGGVDQSVRLSRFRRLLTLGGQELAAGDVHSGVLAAAAALELEEQDEWNRIVRAVAGRSPWLPGRSEQSNHPAAPPPWGERSADWLGAPYLVSLFSGLAAMGAGDPDAAIRELERARESARFAGATLVAESAVRRLAQLRAGEKNGR